MRPWRCEWQQLSCICALVHLFTFYLCTCVFVHLCLCARNVLGCSFGWTLMRPWSCEWQQLERARLANTLLPGMRRKDYDLENQIQPLKSVFSPAMAIEVHAKTVL